MEMPNGFKPFPIPVVSALGPGTQEDEGLEYLPMPQGMRTYDPPALPEPQELAQHDGCVRALRALTGQPGAVSPATPATTPTHPA